MKNQTKNTILYDKHFTQAVFIKRLNQKNKKIWPCITTCSNNK